MSNQTYQSVWLEGMSDLVEQLHMENIPATNEGYKVGFRHFALLYIKYMQIYAKLEECYDRMIHAQKRKFIKAVLENVLIRICEIKDFLILYNPRKLNRFISFDEILADLRLAPDVVDWRFPRFFTRDRDRLDQKELLTKRIEHWLKHFNMSRVPFDLSRISKNAGGLAVIDPFRVDMTAEEAINIIQRNERGRLGVLRVQNIQTWRKEVIQKKAKTGVNNNSLISGSGIVGDDVGSYQKWCATRIAANWKGVVSRKHFAEMREEEFQFLSMAPKMAYTTTTSTTLDILGKLSSSSSTQDEQEGKKRKSEQDEAEELLDKNLRDELDWLRKSKQGDMKAELIEQRRKWIMDVREQTGSFPTDFEMFYSKDGSSIEGVVEGGVEEAKVVVVGSGDTVQEISRLVDEFASVWEKRREGGGGNGKAGNFFDVDLARDSLVPLVEQEVRKMVDELIKEELVNLKRVYDKTGKKKGGSSSGGGDKGTKKKKEKAGSGGKKKEAKGKKWNSAVGLITNKEDCLPDLVEHGILKLVRPARLSDLIGEFSYLGSLLRLQDVFVPSPSLQMVKSNLIEHCMLPLASTLIRQRLKVRDGGSAVARSLLLYGPPGNGKSTIARALATECGASFFDLSPKVLEGKYTQAKTGAALLIYKVFLVAQDNSPAVIFMNDADEVFTVQSKKKGGDSKAAATGGSGSEEGPSRIKKDYMAAVKQVKIGLESNKEDRILFVACTSNPFGEGVDTKELIETFEEKIWIDFPDYGSRVKLWMKFIEEKGVAKSLVRTPSFNVSLLSRASEGYSVQSIKQTVERVLSARRLHLIETGERPLDAGEFLGPLGRTESCSYDLWKKFRDFDHDASGEKARLAELKAAAEGAALAENEKEGKTKDAKKKKK